MDVVTLNQPIAVRKTIALQKGTDPADFSAVLSRTDTLDADGDMFMGGAYDDWIGSAGSFPMLREHNKMLLVGQWANPRMEDEALKADGALLDRERYKEAELAANLLEDGIIDGISVGAWIREYAMDPKDWTLRIYRAEVFEASLVLWPAMESARIEQHKAVVKACRTHLEPSLKGGGASELFAAIGAASTQ